MVILIGKKMDLSNKVVTIAYMSVNSFPAETTVKINITQEVAPGIFKQLDTYDLVIEKSYMATDDPQLLADINQKLTSLP
jgi:hypothetical protein